MDRLVGEAGLNGSLRERVRTKWIVKGERQD